MIRLLEKLTRDELDNLLETTWAEGRKNKHLDERQSQQAFAKFTFTLDNKWDIDGNIMKKLKMAWNDGREYENTAMDEVAATKMTEGSSQAKRLGSGKAESDIRNKRQRANLKDSNVVNEIVEYYNFSPEETTEYIKAYNEIYERDKEYINESKKLKEMFNQVNIPLSLINKNYDYLMSEKSRFNNWTETIRTDFKKEGRKIVVKFRTIDPRVSELFKYEITGFIMHGAGGYFEYLTGTEYISESDMDPVMDRDTLDEKMAFNTAWKLFDNLANVEQSIDLYTPEIIEEDINEKLELTELYNETTSLKEAAVGITYEKYLSAFTEPRTKENIPDLEMFAKVQRANGFGALAQYTERLIKELKDGKNPWAKTEGRSKDKSNTKLMEMAKYTGFDFSEVNRILVDLIQKENIPYLTIYTIGSNREIEYYFKDSNRYRHIGLNYDEKQDRIRAGNQIIAYADNSDERIAEVALPYILKVIEDEYKRVSNKNESLQGAGPSTKDFDIPNIDETYVLKKARRQLLQKIVDNLGASRARQTGYIGGTLLAKDIIAPAYEYHGYKVPTDSDMQKVIDALIETGIIAEDLRAGPKGTGYTVNNTDFRRIYESKDDTIATTEYTFYDNEDYFVYTYCDGQFKYKAGLQLPDELVKDYSSKVELEETMYNNGYEIVDTKN